MSSAEHGGRLAQRPRDDAQRVLRVASCSDRGIMRARLEIRTFSVVLVHSQKASAWHTLFKPRPANKLIKQNLTVSALIKLINAAFPHSCR